MIAGAVTGCTAVLEKIRVVGKNMGFLSETAFPVGLLLPYPLKVMPTKLKVW